jgi:ABC-2 type transport system permease protein
MRWLLVKDLQILRRSPLLTALLILYPIVLAVLIGLAISRSPDRPEVAFLNEIPSEAGLDLGNETGFDQDEAFRRICSRLECVPVDTREEAEQKVRDGEVLAGLVLPEDFLDTLQRQLSTAAEEPATVDVIVNEDDPIKAQLVDDRITGLITEANLILSDRISAVMLGYLDTLISGGEIDIPLLGETIQILGLENSEAALRAIRSEVPKRQQPVVQEVIEFARLARQNLAFADELLSSVRQPIAVNKEVISGDIPPLDTFAISVAAAITLMFVTVLLVAGSLALEREENTFARLTRGLVSRTGLLVEKIGLGTACSLAVTLVLLAALSLFVEIDWGRIYVILPAILLAGTAFAAMGSTIGAAAREVRASALLAFALSLPIAFLSLVPSGTVSETLYDLIRLLTGAFPFRPALDALSGALTAGGPEVWLPFLHLALLAVGYLALARLALRRFA